MSQNLKKGLRVMLQSGRQLLLDTVLWLSKGKMPVGPVLTSYLSYCCLC